MAIQPMQFPFASGEEVNPFAKAITGLVKGYGDVASAEYKKAMAQYLTSPNQALKNLSGLGKTFVEPGIVQAILKQHGVNTGNMPAQGFVYNPSEGQGNEMAQGEQGQGNGGYPSDQGQSPNVTDPYELQRQKMTSDVDTRKRTLFSTNMEKTISRIDSKALTAYSGPKGYLQYGKDLADSMKGNAPQRFKDYEKARKLTEFLTEQVRQFYGTSIQPEVKKAIHELTDPTSIKYSPELAEELFNNNINVLRMEAGTYSEALKNKNPYNYTSPSKNDLLPKNNEQISNLFNKEKNGIKNSSKSTENTGLAEFDLRSNKSLQGLPEGKIEDFKMMGNKKMVKINGKWHEEF